MLADSENDDSLQTIGQVVRLLSDEFPDVTHSSLRFLEREGLITPDRTSGGHRLFPFSQIERIRSIKQWQRQRLSLEEIRSRLASADRLPNLGAVSGELLRLLSRGDRRSAQELLLRADDAGVPLDAIFDNILRPAIRKSSEQSERGDISTGQEMEIASFVRDAVAQLGSRQWPEEQSDGASILAACVEGDHGELELRMLSALLRREGYVVHYLGRDVSQDTLLERVHARRPAAVLLSASRQNHLQSLSETISLLCSALEPNSHPEVIIGGAGVPADWQPGIEARAKFIAGTSLQRAVLQVDRIIREASQSA